MVTQLQDVKDTLTDQMRDAQLQLFSHSQPITGEDLEEEDDEDNSGEEGPFLQI
jgi:hypothetical protein